MFGSMEAAAVWVEGNRLFTFKQKMNPGPSILLTYRRSLPELKKDAEHVIQSQEQFRRAVAIQDGVKRAESLRPFVKSDIWTARREALVELGKSGPPAAPVIDAMLDDPAYSSEAPDLIKALQQAGGEAVSGNLAARLQREIAFWEATGPTLRQNWWNDDAEPPSPLQTKYSLTLELVRALTESPSEGALLPAERLHRLWISLLQLNDPSGPNQMAEESQHLIDVLQGKGGMPAVNPQ